PVKLRTTDEMLPARLDPPPAADLLDSLDDRRLDLLALKRGYESQDATLRAAILAQFPKLTLGVNRAQDTSDVRTIGVGATLELPSGRHLPMQSPAPAPAPTTVPSTQGAQP